MRKKPPKLLQRPRLVKRSRRIRKSRAKSLLPPQVSLLVMQRVSPRPNRILGRDSSRLSGSKHSTKVNSKYKCRYQPNSQQLNLHKFKLALSHPHPRCKSNNHSSGKSPRKRLNHEAPSKVRTLMKQQNNLEQLRKHSSSSSSNRKCREPSCSNNSKPQHRPAT